MTGGDEVSRDEAGLYDRGALVAALGGVLGDMPMAVGIFDTELRLQHCNRTFLEFGQRYASFPSTLKPGMHLTECLPGVDRWMDEFGREIAENGKATREGLELTAKGLTTYWDVAVSPLAENGELSGFVHVVVDATQRVAAMQMLEQRVAQRTAELERRNEAAEGLRDILSILNSCCPQDQVLDYIVRQAGMLLGSDAVSVYQMEASAKAIVTVNSHGIEGDLVPDISFPTDEGFVADTIMQRLPMIVPDSKMLFGPITDRMDPADIGRITTMFTRYRALLGAPIVIGDTVWGALATYYPEPRTFADEDVALATYLADHVALAIENAELREHAEEAAATAERNRLARDLHDAVTQTLFSTSLIAEVLPRLWERNADEGRKRLDELKRLTRGALAEMRTLLLELRPAALVEAELGDVLRQLAEAAATSGVDVDVAVEGEPRRVQPDGQVALYRIAQEALNNVGKHSGASRAEIVLRYGPESVELSVDDNGSGFDPGVVGGDHFGLEIMRERADSVGAAFDVATAPGLGTTITVTLPYAKRSEECACPIPSE